MARWKLFASTTFEIFPRSTCSPVPAKILCLQRYSTNFRNLWLSSEMLRLGIWVGSFRCVDILLLQWQGENFAHRQHLKFCHFEHVHCARKNPISRKVFTRFSKSLSQLEDVQGGHFGGKFQVRRYFTFTMARWKLFASTTFEILPRSTCTLCQQKSYVSKGIYRIFEIFASARRCSGWAFGWKVSGAQVFCFCNGKVKTFRIDNIWNFATFNLYTVPEKIIYLQRYSQDFRNLCLSSKMFRVGIWVESFRCAGILLLQWQGENFSHRQHLKFCHVQPVQCASKNPMYPKVFTEFSKSLPQLEDVEGGHSCGKFQVRRYFTFAMTRWKLFASTTFQILPRSTCSRCQQKSYISKRIQPIFEIFASARRFSGCAFEWEVSGAQVFFFCNGKVKILRAENIWNFAHVQPVPRNSKNPMSPNVLNQFEIFGSARRCWGWAFCWKDPAAQVFYVCNGNVKTLRIDNISNFATFNMYTVLAKILYLQRYSHDFWNLCLSSKMFRSAILGGKFQVRRYFTFAMLRWKLFASTTFEILSLWTCTLGQQKSYIPKGVKPFFEILASARRCSGWACGWKVSGAQVFYFCNGKVKTFRIDNIWNFPTFNLFPVPAKILCLQRYSTNFRNLWLSSEMLRLGIWVGSFRCVDILLLQWQGENFANREHLKFCHFEHVHCARKNPISRKVFTRFSKSLSQLEDVQGGHFGGKFQVRQVFYFYNGKVKTFRIDNIWNFATFNLYTVPAKILCLQRYL